MKVNYSDIKKNTILYGPPGTGKTYNTVNYAVAICDQLTAEEFGEKYPEGSRDKLKRRFDELKDQQRIKVVTFHQSYGYEDFVEGIRPQLRNFRHGGNPGDQRKELDYELHSGVFKEFCEKISKQEYLETINADYELRDILKGLNYKNNNIWLVLTYDNDEEIIKRCFEENIIISPIPSSSKVEEEMKQISEGDIILLACWDSNSKCTTKILGVGQAKAGKPEDEGINKGFPAKSRKVEWKTKQGDEFSAYIPYGWNELVQKVDQILNHVLIIDEVNRGNISKIFGELITLIEETKRLGAKEELKITLPYSQKDFGVPSNLYILGTMNTADRSLVMLDSALRRRFNFVEMPPDTSSLSKVEIKDADSNRAFTVKALLDSINNRIQYLYDAEHLIGQSYFMFLVTEDSENLIADLDNVFRGSIIPLLKEYFYGDEKKVYQVLAGAFYKKKSLDKDINKLFPIDDFPQLTASYTLSAEEYQDFKYEFDPEAFGKFETYYRIINGNKQ